MVDNEKVFGEYAAMTYVVVVGDLIRSKAIGGRSRFQQRFKLITRKLSLQAYPQIASPYTVTLGDEFQAVYHDPRPIFRHLWRLIAYIRPQPIRIAIAMGELSTRINKKAALGMDGPAFHAARKQIDLMKKTESLFSVSSDQDDVELEDTSSLLLSHLIDSWKDNRFKILSQMARDKDVETIASNLRITRTAVYKNIEDGHLNNVLNLGDQIGNSLYFKMQERNQT